MNGTFPKLNYNVEKWRYFLCNRPAIWILSMDWLCQSGLHRPLGFVRVHLHTSGPHQQRCITSTIQNAFSFGMQVEHLHPLCLLGSEDGPKGWSALIFSSSNYLLLAFHLASSPREQACRQKTFDLMICAKDRQFDEWKTENLFRYMVNQPLLCFSFGTESGYDMIFCCSICSSWATNQPIHLWFTISRKDHPPTPKQNIKKEKKPEVLTWLHLIFFSSGRKRRILNLLLTQHGFRFPLLSFGEDLIFQHL